MWRLPRKALFYVKLWFLFGGSLWRVRQSKYLFGDEGGWGESIEWRSTKEIREFRQVVRGLAEDLWIKKPALSTRLLAQSVITNAAKGLLRLGCIARAHIVLVCAEVAWHTLRFVCGILYPFCFYLIVQDNGIWIIRGGSVPSRTSARGHQRNLLRPLVRVTRGRPTLCYRRVLGDF